MKQHDGSRKNDSFIASSLSPWQVGSFTKKIPRGTTEEKVKIKHEDEQKSGQNHQKDEPSIS